MATPDMDVIKEIPGYKVILKAVLKSQIQQLVEQLASSTNEESVILTASVTDGTLSHLGSDSAKGFLEDHEEVKSQFLGFCLKKHHRKAQEEKEEKERQEAEARQASMMAKPVHMSGPPYGMRSPRYQSPRGAHPVSMLRASPGNRMAGPGVRHEPYPITRPRRSPLNFDPGRGPGLSPLQSPARKSLDGQIIKIEPEDDNENSNQSDQPGSTSQSPSHQSPSTPSKVKTEAGNNDNDEDAQSESSNSNIPSEQTTETNLGLDSDLSTLISGANNDTQTETDPNVSVKLEALTESEMELEITGVEPGRPMPQSAQETWDPNVSMGMNFDPTGATGSQGDLSQQGYSVTDDLTHHCKHRFQYFVSNATLQKHLETLEPNTDDNGKPLVCIKCGKVIECNYSLTVDQTEKNQIHCDSCIKVSSHCNTTDSNDKVENLWKCGECGKSYKFKSKLRLHLVTHGEIKPFKCDICGKSFKWKNNLKNHITTHTVLKPFKCTICGKTFTQKDDLDTHLSEKTPFTCDICGHPFPTKDKLLSHMLFHDGIKPYVCGTCGKAFRVKHTLEKHIAAHFSSHNYVVNLS